MTYSSEDNLKITLRENKDGTYNLNDLKKYKQADVVKQQLKYFDSYQRVYLHSSEMRSGYIPRANGCKIRKYNGEKGVGYEVNIPNFHSNKQYERRYYLFKRLKENESVDDEDNNEDIMSMML